jgi:sugar phosphate isomerase/epimerase
VTTEQPIVNRDLLATCWTHAGNAAPLVGDETSPIDLRTRVETVAKTGWQGINLLHADLAKIKNTTGWKDLRNIIDDNGIKYVELEMLADWWTTGERRAASDLVRADLFEAAEILGAKTLKVGTEIFGRPVDEQKFHEEFDVLATQAGNVGTRVAVEPMPMSTNLNTIEAGAKFVKEVGNPYGGLAVDIWHTYRGGTKYSDLPTILPMEHVFLVEIDDGDEEVVGTLWEDTINQRRLPGDGVFDVPAFVKAVYEAGWRGHWGVEIISEAHRRRPIEEALTEAHQKAAASLEAAARLIASGARSV